MPWFWSQVLSLWWYMFSSETPQSSELCSFFFQGRVNKWWIIFLYWTSEALALSGSTETAARRQNISIIWNWGCWLKLQFQHIFWREVHRRGLGAWPINFESSLSGNQTIEAATSKQNCSFLWGEVCICWKHRFQFSFN